MLGGNANITRIGLTYENALLIWFDRAVIVDTLNPPTTWVFNGGTSIQPYGFNFPQGTYFFLNSPVSPGDAVVISADDPAARTPQGGYVNGGAFTVEDL